MPEQVTIFFAEDFEAYLREKGNSNDYVMKNILLLKKVLKQAVISGQLKYNPLDSYEFHYERKFKNNHLSTEDLKKIESSHITQEKLSNVRDCFVFCCYTGLSYSDLSKFNYSAHTYLRGSRRWIRVSREKTEVDSLLPLLPEAAKILESHNYELPVVNNAKMNSYLKEIADVCGLSFLLTTHVARKTFGYLMLNEHGFPLEAVSRMLGHNSIRTTQAWYVKVEEGNIEKYVYRDENKKSPD
jgi:site-specific recombinase XerD